MILLIFILLTLNSRSVKLGYVLKEKISELMYTVRSHI